MTDSEWKALGRYVRDMANRLGLRDWLIMLHREPPPDQSAGAYVEATPNRKYADIWVCRDFRDLPAETQRHYVVHELLHLHFCDAGDHLCDLVAGGILSQASADQAGNTLKRVIEYGVDGVAYEIARLYPLIPWSANREKKPKRGGQTTAKPTGSKRGITDAH